MARYYLSGPIEALDALGNKPTPALIEARKSRFGKVKAQLEQMGREIVSPIEVEACGGDFWFCDGASTGKHTWNCYLRYDVAALAMCHYIVMLEGWERSPGAQLELKVAILLDICPLFWSGGETYWYPRPIGEEAQRVYKEMITS